MREDVEKIINELLDVHAQASAYADTYKHFLEHTAAKLGVNKKALTQYIKAESGGKQLSLRLEAQDVIRLLDGDVTTGDGTENEHAMEIDRYE